MFRRLTVTLLGVSIACAAGCTREEAADTRRAIEVGKEVEKEASGPVGWLVKKAEEEKKEEKDQLARLDKTVADVERLINEGKYDEAEVKAATISWTPVVNALNETDKLLVAQYDEKRRTLQGIIERRRQPR